MTKNDNIYGSKMYIVDNMLNDYRKKTYVSQTFLYWYKKIKEGLSIEEEQVNHK